MTDNTDGTPRCNICNDKGYIEAKVHADARYYSPTPVATRIICWNCRPQQHNGTEVQS